MRINTNVSALTAQRNLGITNAGLARAIERLSSGFRISRAADDAAGLTISEKLIAQIKGVNQAVRNSQDGISLLQTAEGALGETHTILQRMRELAVQAANDTLNDQDRLALDVEVQELIDAIDRVASTTQFNNLVLLDGSLRGERTDIESAMLPADGIFSLAIHDVAKTTEGTYTLGYNSATSSMTLTDPAGIFTQTIDVTDQLPDVGQVSSIDFDLFGISITINDSFDVNFETSFPAGGEFDVTNTDQPFQLQVGANAGEIFTISFGDMQALALGVADVSLATSDDASSALEIIDDAINAVSDQRSRLGASQNTLEHIIHSLGIASENLSASESRIRDLDVAAETVTLTKLQILQQAGTAVLAQANMTPQSVLQLLRQ